MNYLLMKSLQISYENDPSKTLNDVAKEVDMSLSEFNNHAKELGIPTSEWEKVCGTLPEDTIEEDTLPEEPIEDTAIVAELLDYEEDTIVAEPIDDEEETELLPTTPTVTPPKPSMHKDVIKENLDALTKAIIVQARSRLDENPDIDTRELKDLTQIVSTLENLKYPKSNKLAWEVDTQKGITRFLAEVSQ